jgi:hypothetical protein
MKLFRHPGEVNETYPQHARYALKCGGRLLLSALCFILHAIWPSWPIPDKYNLLQMGIWIHIEVMERDWDRSEAAVAAVKKKAAKADGRPKLELIGGRTQWK